MSDPSRVTRAVRRCETCRPAKGAWLQPDLCPNPDCNGGWVDVPVDEQCPTCRGRGEVHDKYLGPGKRWRMKQCGRCGGSGRRLHNWATGWYWGDTFLWRGRGPFAIGKTIDYTNWPLMEQCATLVLSDPSHRPEPMRWKQ